MDEAGGDESLLRTRRTERQGKSSRFVSDMMSGKDAYCCTRNIVLRWSEETGMN